MKKPRFYLSLLALLFVIGAGLLLWPGHRAGSSAIPAAPASHAAGGSSRILAPDVSAKPITRVVFHAPFSAGRAEAPGSLAVGSLLADSSLDNKAVMSSLAKMTLDVARPIEERTEAMGHLLNLSVEDPSAVLLPLVGDPRLSDALCNQILDDALNDSLVWQADANFDVLKHRENSEGHAKARDHLVFLMGADHGDNFFEWSTAIALSKEKWAQAKK